MWPRAIKDFFNTPKGSHFCDPIGRPGTRRRAQSRRKPLSVLASLSINDQSQTQPHRRRPPRPTSTSDATGFPSNQICASSGDMPLPRKVMIFLFLGSLR